MSTTATVVAATLTAARLLTSASGDESGGVNLWDIGIATIFAREFLEASLIIGQYRTVITKSSDWEGENQTAALKAVTTAAVVAALVALAVCVATIIPLAILSRELDDKILDVIEGVSKMVAAICVLQLSLKIPKWMGVYPQTPKERELGLSLKDIRFNVAWNIWREMAECGVFIIPFILDGNASAIPISAVVGTVIALIMGGAIYYTNQKQDSKIKICVLLSFIMAMLSIGLFVGGSHEFEEVWGETPVVWKINGDFWSHKKFPFVLIKPFGYSSKRTVLQIATFWSWAALAAGLHYYKYKQSQKFVAQKAAEETSDEKEVDIEAAAE